MRMADLGTFDLVTSFEVFEHVPDIDALFFESAAAGESGRPPSFFSTMLSDGEIVRGKPLTWWLRQRRATGHISLSLAKSLRSSLQQTRVSVSPAPRPTCISPIAVCRRGPGTCLRPEQPLSVQAPEALELDLPALRVDVAQPGIDHRGVDKVDLAAAAGEALRGAQPVGRAEQVAERIARLGLGAQRAQRQAEPAPGLAERPRRASRRDGASPRSASRWLAP